MSSGSWIELDSDAIAQNLACITNQLEKTRGSALQLGLVVKGNAYGHGLREIVLLTHQNSAVHIYFTASLAEALFVHRLGVKQRICAFVPADTDYLPDALAASIELVCCDEFFIEKVAECARKEKRRARIHVKVDTGLSRLGIYPDKMPTVCTLLKKYPELELAGVMTHFVDMDQLETTAQQRENLEAACAWLKKTGCTCDIHGAASGSIPFASQDTLVRIGTALYGYWKTPAQRERYQERFGCAELKPVMTWKSRIMHTKKVSAGQGIGYGHTFTPVRDTHLGVIPVGYADGYPRGLSNKSIVYIRGCAAPIIGMVSMNMLTVDLTDIPGAVTGDEVLLLGNHEGIRARDLAAPLQTTQLEILTRISGTIPRVIVSTRE